MLKSLSLIFILDYGIPIKDLFLGHRNKDAYVRHVREREKKKNASDTTEIPDTTWKAKS